MTGASLLKSRMYQEFHKDSQSSGVHGVRTVNPATLAIQSQCAGKSLRDMVSALGLEPRTL